MVPRTLFTIDGKLSLESKNADVMHGITEEMKQVNVSQINEEEAISEATAIFDGMAVVNKIKLRLVVQNCRHLAEAFLKLCCVMLVMPSKSVLCLIDIWSPH